MPVGAGLQAGHAAYRGGIGEAVKDQAEVDFKPYTALPRKTPLDEMNPGVAGPRGLQRQLAIPSTQMDFTEPGTAPEDLLNRVIWHSR